MVFHAKLRTLLHPPAKPVCVTQDLIHKTPNTAYIRFDHLGIRNMEVCHKQSKTKTANKHAFLPTQTNQQWPNQMEINQIRINIFILWCVCVLSFHSRDIGDECWCVSVCIYAR